MYIYLAAPYSHPDLTVRQKRFEQINACVAQLMRQGITVYSPISHCHPIAIEHDLPTDWSYWQHSGEIFVTACSKLYVLKLSGWQESVGVKAEIELAVKNKIPITYLNGDVYETKNPS
jgi:hypothetical protein